MNLFSRKNKQHLTTEEKSARRKDRLLMVLSGLLIGISFTPFPYPVTLFLFFSFVPFFFVLEKKQTLLAINRLSYITFFVLSLITIYWVGSWQSKADPFLMAGGGVLIFFYPVVLLINTTIFYLSTKIFGKKVAIWLFPLFWVTGEFLLTLTDLKFPWLTLGHGLAKFTAFIQIADIIGAFGLSIVVLYINLFVYKSAVSLKTNFRKSLVYLSAGFLIFLIVIIYGSIKISDFKESEKKIKVGIIQPNIDPWDKWQGGSLTDLLNEYFNLSQQCVDNGAKIIIWPETALPVYLLSGGYHNEVDSIYSFLKKNNVSLLTGMPNIVFHGEKGPKYSKYSDAGNYYYSTFNSILLFQPNDLQIQTYGKMHLVPLGEHVPFVNTLPFLGEMFKWGVGLSGWNVGQDTTVFKVNLNNDNVNIGGIVCYESVFPVFVSHFVEKGAQFLVVVTNDSWYGNSSGPYQHKEFSALRAVENRRAVIRCANGGISCLINSLGITEVETQMFTKTTLVVDVSLSESKTFYTNNPFIVPILSSVFSLWIIGLNILMWIKRKLQA